MNDCYNLIDLPGSIVLFACIYVIYLIGYIAALYFGVHNKIIKCDLTALVIFIKYIRIITNGENIKLNVTIGIIRKNGLS